MAFFSSRAVKCTHTHSLTNVRRAGRDDGEFTLVCSCWAICLRCLFSINRSLGCVRIYSWFSLRFKSVRDILKRNWATKQHLTAKTWRFRPKLFIVLWWVDGKNGWFSFRFGFRISFFIPGGKVRTNDGWGTHRKNFNTVRNQEYKTHQNKLCSLKDTFVFISTIDLIRKIIDFVKCRHYCTYFKVSRQVLFP